MTTIYLIRHGEISQRQPRRYVGQSELDLTPAGREQMDRLAIHLSRFPIDRFFCSPLGRCRRSCEILTARFPGLRPEVVAPLAEISLGAWEGLTVDQVEARYPGSYQERGKDIARYRPPLGESFLDLQRRAWPAFTAIAEAGEKQVAVVAHAGVNRVLLCHLLGMKLSHLFCLEQAYGCLNTILYRAGRFRLASLNALF